MHQKEKVINETHSRVVQSSLINLGIDQDRDVDMGHSARLYRVMCAGGLYMVNATKGLDRIFNVNKDGAILTGEEDLVLYYSFEDMVNKIDFLLEHEDIRNKIRLNGQKKVIENHTFEHRLGRMFELFKKDKKKVKK
jgi:spore maturation protein CgeB